MIAESKAQHEWDELLPDAEYIMNTARLSVILGEHREIVSVIRDGSRY